MSHDGTWIVRRNGRERYYYTRWGGLSLNRDLLQGPSAVLPFMESLEERPTPFLYSWLNGLALVDFDARVLLYWASQAGGVNCLWLALFQRLMAATWPGWSTRWLMAPALDLAAALPHLARDILENMVPPEPYTVEQFARDQHGIWQEALSSGGCDDDIASAGPDIVRSWVEWDTHRTWVVLDGRSLLAADDWNCSRLLRCGPAAVEVLRARPEETALPWANVIESCYRIDTANHRLDWWIGQPSWAHHGIIGFSDRWPGWECRPLPGGPQQLAAESGADPRAMVTTDGLNRVADALERLLGPRTSGAEILAAATRSITLAPDQTLSVIPPGPGDEGPKEVATDLRALALRILSEDMFQPP